MLSKYNLRGEVGIDLTEKHIKDFAKNIVGYIYQNKLNKSVLVGKDNRLTSDYILNIVSSVLLKYGIEISLIGVSTTPQLVYLTRRFKFDLGLMITASHNNFKHNGIKCFDRTGQMIDLQNMDFENRFKIDYVKCIDFSNHKETYLCELKNKLNKNQIKCVFDCANGATIDVVRKVFGKQNIIGADTSGRYINENYGSENLDKIVSTCKRSKKIGFAFDGDGDRVIAVSKNGDIIDGDKILYILATQMLGFGDKLIGTQISSLALEISLRRFGVALIREKVGAKYVYTKMIKEGCILGGESCGHIFLNGISDGVRVAMELLNILNRTGLDFDELLKGYKKMYRFTKDVAIGDVINCDEYEQTSKDIRIVVRKSITESKLRILVEGIDEKLTKLKFEEIVSGAIGDV